ncbi:hypothetical protein AgCh_012676 [Apium graveolens]
MTGKPVASGLVVVKDLASRKIRMEMINEVRTVRVEKRLNEFVNRLNKTKVERTPDLKAEREAVNAAERAERKLQLRDKKRREEIESLEKERQAEVRSYKNLMVANG